MQQTLILTWPTGRLPSSVGFLLCLVLVSAFCLLSLWLWPQFIDHLSIIIDKTLLVFYQINRDAIVQHNICKTEPLFFTTILSLFKHQSTKNNKISTQYCCWMQRNLWYYRLWCNLQSRIFNCMVTSFKGASKHWNYLLMY